MQLRKLVLADYRNLERATIEFGPRFTVLSGHNGAGKTNVLEALWLLGTLRSFRGSGLSDLIRHGRDGARVELQAFDTELAVPTRLSVTIDRGARSTRRTARLDDKVVRSAAEFYGHLPAVLFTPEDLAVLRGSPTGRRQFLDRVVFARDRAHLRDVVAYDKLVRSRNRLLKGDGPQVSTGQRDELLDTYDSGIADHGARIWNRRRALVAAIRARFTAAFERVHGPGIAPGLHYAPKIELLGDDARGSLAAALAERRARDLLRGVTTVGPHRDDLEVTLDGRLAGQFASQGQARALILAFKIAELELGAERNGGRAPLLLLDDVSSELDPARNARLFSTLSALGGQCVLTTTAAEFIRLDRGVQRADLSVVEGTIQAPDPAPVEAPAPDEAGEESPENEPASPPATRSGTDEPVDL